MLLDEDLARAQMRKAERFARHLRVARQLRSGRRWSRLARWAERKAERALTFAQADDTWDDFKTLARYVARESNGTFSVSGDTTGRE